MGPWGTCRYPLISLGKRAEVQLGKMLQPEPNLPTDVLVPYLRAGSLTSFGDDFDRDLIPEMYASQRDLHAYAVRPDDLVVAEGGDVGRPAYVPQSVPCPTIIQNSLHRVRTSHGDIRFLSFTLQAIHAGDWLEVLCNRSTFGHLTVEKLKALPVPCPPPHEQHAIADYLDAETARIDALIEKKRRMVKLLAERDQTFISSILVPSNSVFVRLGRLASVQSGLTVDGSRESGPGAVTRPYLRVANVQDGWLDLETVTEITVPIEIAARSTLRAGDVLMTEGGDLDKLGRGTLWEGQLSNCLHQNHIFAVRTKGAFLDPTFLALLTSTRHARRYFESTGVRTTNLASTNSSKIMDFPIPLLGVEEQRHLVSQYTVVAERGASLASRLSSQLRLLVEHRQALITAAVTGQLDVPGVTA